MAQLIVHAEDQIKRLNQQINNMQELAKLPPDILIQRPTTNQWSILEIIEHMNIASKVYHPKIQKALETVPESNVQQDGFLVKGMPKLVIRMISPKNGERPWKLKTMKKFEPIIEDLTSAKSDIEPITKKFIDYQHWLKKQIIASRNRVVDRYKFASAVGPIVQFKLPACFEFIISHQERHFQQIEDWQKLLKG